MTLVERTTRFTCIRRVANKKDDEVAAAIAARLETLPQGLLETLTFDNGKEFAKFKRIEKKLGLRVYFAKPYHSWERGATENRNGLVRNVLPKGTSFQDIADEGLLKIDALLNDRPLRCLKWRMSREAFGELLKGGPEVV